MSDTNITDQVAENAVSPKKVKGDSGEVEQHALKDQIEAARFFASREAARGKGLGVKISKMVSPGS